MTALRSLGKVLAIGLLLLVVIGIALMAFAIDGATVGGLK